MNLRTKKQMIARTFNIGLARIVLDSNRNQEIKEAITRQDIKDLKKQGIIKIKPIKGRKKNVKRKTKKRAGKIKKRIKNRKQEYVKLVRKLRQYIKILKQKSLISNEKYLNLRKQIRAKKFRDINQIKAEIK